MPVRPRLGPDPVAAVEELAGIDAVQPLALDPLAILRMNRVQPAAAQVFIGRRPVIARHSGKSSAILPVGVVTHTTCAPACTSERYRSSLRRSASSEFRRLGDIGGDQHHPGDLPGRITRREPREIPVPHLLARADRLARHRTTGSPDPQHAARGGLGAGRPDRTARPARAGAQELARADAVQAGPEPGSPCGSGGHRRGGRNRSARRQPASQAAQNRTRPCRTREVRHGCPVLTGDTPYPCERVP